VPVRGTLLRRRIGDGPVINSSYALTPALRPRAFLFFARCTALVLARLGRAINSAHVYYIYEESEMQYSARASIGKSGLFLRQEDLPGDQTPFHTPRWSHPLSKATCQPPRCLNQTGLGMVACPKQFPNKKNAVRTHCAFVCLLVVHAMPKWSQIGFAYTSAAAVANVLREMSAFYF
jgi:hypothetical protein